MSHPNAGPPPFVPADVPAAHEGSGTWGDGRVDYAWSLQDISDKHHLMDTCGHGVFFVAKAKVRERGLFKRLLWIQYTEAIYQGSVYVPPATPDRPSPSPWRGIDRYPNTARPDNLPYTALPDEQRYIDWGSAFEGAVRSLYSPGDADTVDVDWACSGGMLDWSHFSVVSLIGRGHSGKEWRLGSLTWVWSVDAGGGRFTFGARPADEQEVALWGQRLGEGYPSYVRDVYAGDWHV